MRYILAAVFMLGAPMEAGAAVADHCDGKYLHAAGLVDAAYRKYGTLYSGGLHKHRTDHVGATLDLYRLWRGLPDLGLRSTDVVGIRGAYEGADNYYNNPAVSLVWARARWAAQAEGAPEEERAHAFAAYGFERLTGRTSTLDAWRRGEVEPQEDGEGWPRAVALMAEHASLDWMQSVAVASTAEYTFEWHLDVDMSEESRAAHTRIAEADWERFRAGDGIEWAVSAALHTSDPSQLEGFAETVRSWSDGVRNCEASPGDYAALASTQAVLGRFQAYAFRRPRNDTGVDLLAQMPVKIISTIQSRRFRRGLLGLPRRCTQNSDDPLSDGVSVEWVMKRLYAACEIEHVPLSESAYAFRAYNLLSADHLAALGRREGAPAGLLRAAFARHVALGHWQSAEALLEDLKAASPQSAERIDAEWQATGRPEPLRLARIILFTPNLSTMVASTKDSEPGMRLHVWNVLGGVDESGSVAGIRNLLPEYLSDEILQRDYEVMLRLPHRWGAFAGSRWGYYNSPIGRAMRRGERYRAFAQRNGKRSAAAGWRRIGRPGSRDGVPFIQNLTDAAELQDLSGDAALMRTVSDIILGWSEVQTSGRWARWFGNHEDDAEALAQLIELCRYNECGAYAGTPQAERAFKILKLRMGRTDAAKATKYWWARRSDLR